MKKLLFVKLLLLPIFTVLVGCNSYINTDGYISSTDDYYSGADYSGAEGDYIPGEYETDGESGNGENLPRAGQLTSGVYDDNEEYEFWTTLINQKDEQDDSSEDSSNLAGIFSSYTKYDFNTFNRLHLTLPKNLRAKISLLDEDNNPTFTTYSLNDGNAYLFSDVSKETYNVKIDYIDQNNESQSIVKEVTNDDVITLDDINEISNNKLDIMFVIDTTGSMGDEMSYLKAEIVDVIDRVKASFEDISVRLALEFYRDVDDDYITRYFDFTKDISYQAKQLGDQTASGGGDFPEAVHRALNEAVKKDWDEEATKLIFHVADAPSHDSEIKDWNSSILKASESGINVIPIACSGMDDKTQYLFRSEAILSGGKYIYLTDDSGIGFSHNVPLLKYIPTVEYLNDAIVRVIKGYQKGSFEEPICYKDVQN